MKVRRGIVKYFLVLITPMTVCASSKFSLRLIFATTRRGRGWWGLTRVGYLGADLQVFETETSPRSRNDNCYSL